MYYGSFQRAWNCQVHLELSLLADGTPLAASGHLWLSFIMTIIIKNTLQSMQPSQTSRCSLAHRVKDNGTVLSFLWLTGKNLCHCKHSGLTPKESWNNLCVREIKFSLAFYAFTTGNCFFPKLVPWHCKSNLPPYFCLRLQDTLCMLSDYRQCFNMNLFSLNTRNPKLRQNLI